MINLAFSSDEPPDRTPEMPLKNAVRLIRKYLPSDMRFHPSVKSAVRRLLVFAEAEERIHIRCLRRVRALRAEVQIAQAHGNGDLGVCGSDKYAEALGVLDRIEGDLLDIDPALDTH